MSTDHRMDQEEGIGTVSPASGFRHGELRWVSLAQVTGGVWQQTNNFLLCQQRVEHRGPGLSRLLPEDA
jgi:hypothetical protein